MYSSLGFIFNQITVIQSPLRIVINGLRTKPLLKAIEKTFGSGRVTIGMFYAKTSFRIEIPLFFAYDFLEIIRILIIKETPYVNKKLLTALEAEILKLPVFQRVLEPIKTKLDKKRLLDFKVTPLEKQTEFFDVYDENTQKYGLDGYILASPPGTGKTLTSLFLAAMLKHKKVIIFSPNNAMERVWELTFNNFYKVPPKYFIYGKKRYNGNESHFVFSHENLKFAFEFIKENLKEEPTTIIVDECHAFTEMKSERTKLLIEISNFLNCKDILFMSGTPFKALGAEVIPFLWCSDPTFTIDAEERFKKVFGIGGTRAIDVLAARIGRSMYRVDKTEVVSNVSYNIDLKVKIPNGDNYTLSSIKDKMKKFIKERVTYYNLHENRFLEDYKNILGVYESRLKDRNELLKLSVYKKEALKIRETKQLGTVKEIIVRCNEFEKKTIVPSLPSGLKEKFRDASSVYKYVRLKIQGEALGRILGTEREMCNVDILKNINNSKIFCDELDYNGEDYSLQDIFAASKSKVIFFTDYVEVIIEAKEAFEKLGFKPAVVYGDTNKDLNSILQGVEKDPKINPIVATYKSLSTAVPLTMCSTAVFLNVPYRDYIYTQATARLDRLGQKNELFFYHVYLDTGDEPNISTRSKDIMMFSKEMVEALMGGGLDTDTVILEESFLENFKSTRKQ